MNELERAMLLSVHPRFANSILDGTKTVEVRRQRVAVPVGTPVMLYATAPTMALVGTARVSAVHIAPPADVWSAHHSATAISREEFDDYMSGASQASAITLEAPTRITDPVPLSALRATADFHPPQSYRYLAGDDLRHMTETYPAADTALQKVLSMPAMA
ncbi:ASCH domain-containing protein [Streptomyces sp. NPDC002187]|uniref:ASCH domain-containing protein n=1 Tax=Streptomyces sp. NPDC002187 TaxID=3364637 RepID=UPI003690117B